MPDRPLNATAASLLGFLTSGPASGSDLLRTAQLVIGRFWSITRARCIASSRPWNVTG